MGQHSLFSTSNEMKTQSHSKATQSSIERTNERATDELNRKMIFMSIGLFDGYAQHKHGDKY